MAFLDHCNFSKVKNASDAEKLCEMRNIFLSKFIQEIMKEEIKRQMSRETFNPQEYMELSVKVATKTLYENKLLGEWFISKVGNKKVKESLVTLVGAVFDPTFLTKIKLMCEGQEWIDTVYRFIDLNLPWDCKLESEWQLDKSNNTVVIVKKIK